MLSDTHTGLEVAGCFLVELVICPGPLALGPPLPPLGVLLSQPARPAVLPWYWGSIGHYILPSLYRDIVLFTATRTWVLSACDQPRQSDAPGGGGGDVGATWILEVRGETVTTHFIFLFHFGQLEF